MALTSREIRASFAGHDIAFVCGMARKLKESDLKLYIDGEIADELVVGESVLFGPTLTLRAKLPSTSRDNQSHVIRAVARVAPFGLRAHYEIYADDTLIKKTASWFGY